MGAELGRISGPLLAANLLRHGANLSFETDLLYLDVNSGTIGVKTDTPSKQLEINGTASTTNLIADTKATIADLVFISNKIQNLTGSITVTPDQATDPTVVTHELQSSKLDFVNRTISTLNDDDDINLVSNGTGQVVFNSSKVKVNGDLHATGDITWDGDIIFGNGNTDSVSFNADLTSDLIPDLDNQYDIGAPLKQWNTLYAGTAVANFTNLSSLTANNIDMLLTQGETIYVSINGNDSYSGVYTSNTFRTIKHALSMATRGDTIVIFPGNYVEEFPLIVPTGVTLSGSSLRDVTISPTLATIDKDCFLFNGDATVENVLVTGFKYNAIDNTGYAFRFAPGMKTIARSPYIRNVSVKTEEPNAGYGALIDGSSVDPDTLEPAMLFYSTTMLIPGADGVTVTNGARVEWLNSFTYFAYRGLHLTRGTLGKASLGVKFGAEVRSINSANVYGTYGAIADGLDTLAYLVGHNFGYIGTGSNLDNDSSLSLQANEVIQINGGIIYFDSMDHKGDYRVGEIFYVNQQTGQVSFNAQSINFSATGNITIDGPNGQIILDATKVQVSNIKIHDNNIDSLVGPVNFSAQSGTTTLNTTVNVIGSTNVTGDTIVKGNIFLGDTALDLITIKPNLTQNIVPGLNNTYNIGTKLPAAKVWNTGFLTTFNVDGITELTNNTISTLTSDYDLRLQAAGTGKVIISSTDVQVDNNLSTNSLNINGTSTLQDTTIDGIVTLTGNIGQTGDTYITGLFGNHNISITDVDSYIAVPDIKIQHNTISTTATDSDIVFTGTGTGGVVIDNKLKILNNVISNVWSGASTNSQKSIIFNPTGTGSVSVYANTFLQVPVGNNSNRILSTQGEIRLNPTTHVYEGYQTYTNEVFMNLYSSDNKTYITPELVPGANDNTLRLVANNVVKVTIDSTKLHTDVFKVGNFELSGNTIHNTVSGADMQLSPTGTGYVDANGLLFKDETITNDTNGALVLTSTGIGYFKFGGTGAVVFPYGDNSQRRSTPELGETRNNTEIGYMEVFNGTSWIPAVGTSGAAPLSEVLDIMDTWSLILG